MQLTGFVLDDLHAILMYLDGLRPRDLRGDEQAILLAFSATDRLLRQIHGDRYYQTVFWNLDAEITQARALWPPTRSPLRDAVEYLLDLDLEDLRQAAREVSPEEVRASVRDVALALRDLHHALNAT